MKNTTQMKPNPTKKPRRPKRPKPITPGNLNTFYVDSEYRQVVIGFDELNAKEARKLAKWLVKAAEYLEGKDENS